MMTKTKAPLDIRMVSLSKIIIPTEYQREFKPSKAKAIADDFKAEECGVLPITERNDGTFAATDAQHRIAALRMMGVEEWLCLVMPPRPLAEEAQVFVDLQRKRTNLTGRDLWRARRAAKDPVVLDIEEVVHELGLEIEIQKKKSWRSIQATGALERIYESMGRNHLRDVLRTVGNAWPEDPDAFKSVVLLGTASFLFYYENDPIFRRSEVVDKFSNWPIRRVLQRASELTGITGGGFQVRYGGKKSSVSFAWSPGMVRTLVQAYNFKRSTRQIEEPTLKGWRAIAKYHSSDAG